MNNYEPDIRVDDDKPPPKNPRDGSGPLDYRNSSSQKLLSIPSAPSQEYRASSNHHGLPPALDLNLAPSTKNSLDIDSTMQQQRAPAMAALDAPLPTQSGGGPLVDCIGDSTLVYSSFTRFHGVKTRLLCLLLLLGSRAFFISAPFVLGLYLRDE